MLLLFECYPFVTVSSVICLLSVSRQLHDRLKIGVSEKSSNKCQQMEKKERVELVFLSLSVLFVLLLRLLCISLSACSSSCRDVSCIVSGRFLIRHAEKQEKHLELLTVYTCFTSFPVPFITMVNVNAVHDSTITTAMFFTLKSMCHFLLDVSSSTSKYVIRSSRFKSLLPRNKQTE